VNWLADPETWVSFITLSAMEIVLGIDNIILLTLIAGQAPKKQQNKARVLGLLFAMVTRILLLLSITWVMRLQTPLFEIVDQSFSCKDLILIFGGFFLIAKSTYEIHNVNESNASTSNSAKKPPKSLLITVVEIAIIDIVFSIDSVVTAVGMARHIEVMMAAIITSVMIMFFSAQYIGRFIENNPTIKTLALSFLLLIGVTLIAEGLSFYIPKGYIYFAMAFSLSVECLNIRKSKRKKLKGADH